MLFLTLLCILVGTFANQNAGVKRGKHHEDQNGDDTRIGFIGHRAKRQDPINLLNQSYSEATAQLRVPSWRKFQQNHILTRRQLPSSKTGWKALMRSRDLQRSKNTFILVNSDADVVNLRTREFSVPVPGYVALFSSSQELTVYVADSCNTGGKCTVKTGRDYVLVGKINGDPVHYERLQHNGAGLIDVVFSTQEPSTDGCLQCTTLGTKCYVQASVDEHLTNLEAVQKCNLAGGSLPYFENELDYSLFKTWGCAVGQNRSAFWLGYYNFQPHSLSQPGIWRTLYGQTPGFTGFHSDEPNGIAENEFCTVGHCSHGWVDHVCGHIYSWLSPTQLLCQCPISTADCIWQDWSDCSTKVAECAAVCDTGDCEGQEVHTCQPCLNCFGSKSHHCPKCMKKFKLSLTTGQLRTREVITSDSQCSWQDWLQCGMKVAECLPVCGTCVVEFLTCPACLSCFGNRAGQCLKCLTKFLHDPLSLY